MSTTTVFNDVTLTALFTDNQSVDLDIKNSNKLVLYAKYTKNTSDQLEIKVEYTDIDSPVDADYFTLSRINEDGTINVNPLIMVPEAAYRFDLDNLGPESKLRISARTPVPGATAAKLTLKLVDDIRSINS